MGILKILFSKMKKETIQPNEIDRATNQNFDLLSELSQIEIDVNNNNCYSDQLKKLDDIMIILKNKYHGYSSERVLLDRLSKFGFNYDDYCKYIKAEMRVYFLKDEIDKAVSTKVESILNNKIFNVVTIETIKQLMYSLINSNINKAEIEKLDSELFLYSGYTPIKDTLDNYSLLYNDYISYLYEIENGPKLIDIVKGSVSSMITYIIKYIESDPDLESELKACHF